MNFISFTAKNALHMLGKKDVHTPFHSWQHVYVYVVVLSAWRLTYRSVRLSVSHTDASMIGKKSSPL